MEIRKAVLADLDGITLRMTQPAIILKHTKTIRAGQGVYPARADARQGLRENALYAALVGEMWKAAFSCGDRRRGMRMSVGWRTMIMTGSMSCIHCYPSAFSAGGIGTEIITAVY